tara:strand:- start:191 stop:790 length:600 start_codon:yes stop_codon:yes gene_type:complete
LSRNSFSAIWLQDFLSDIGELLYDGHHLKYSVFFFFACNFKAFIELGKGDLMFRQFFSIFISVITLYTPVTAGETLSAWKANPSQIFSTSDVDLEDMIWAARPLIIFANSPLDPTFKQQMALLQESFEVLIERDVMVVVDTNPNSKSILRKNLRPKGFVWVLIGKDGTVKLRKPFAWDMRELSRVIDKMPMRQQEIKEP